MEELSHSEVDGNAELWGLINFVKNNPAPFKSLNGDEIWELVSDEPSFWDYYEKWLGR